MRKPTFHRLLCASVLAAMPLSTSQALATNGTWSNLSGGAWSLSTNWSGGLIANGASGIANFSTLNITADRTITLDSSRTIGTLIFGDNSLPDHNWILDNGTTSNFLTLNNGTASAFIQVNNQTATVNLLLTGAAALTKTGAGTLVLNTAVSYTGGTTISAGTIVSGATNVLPFDSPINGAGTFDLNDHSQEVTSVGSITITNSAPKNPTLTFNASGAISTPVSLTGNLNFVKTGAGTLTPSIAWSYIGNTTLNQGTFKLGTNNLFPSATSLTMNSPAILDLNSHFQTIASLAGSGTITNSSGTSGSLAINNISNCTAAISITGDLALLKSGAGAFTLSAAANYSRDTDIADGPVICGVANALPIFTNLLFDPGGSLDLSGHNQQVALFASNDLLFGYGNISNSSLTPATFSVFPSADTLTFTPVSGNLSFAKLGSASLLLNTPNAYTGFTIVSGGTLLSGLPNVLPTTTTLSVAAGALFDLNGNAQQVAGFADAGVITNSSLNSVTFTINNAALSGGPTHLAGNLSLVKLGAGILQLGGTCSYTGSTTIAQGTLQTTADFVFPNNNSLFLNPGATLDLNGHFQFLAGLFGSGSVINSGAAPATLEMTNAGDQLTFVSITGPITLFKIGGPLLTLAAPLSITGNIQIAGPLELDAPVNSAGAILSTLGPGIAGGQLIIAAGASLTSDGFAPDFFNFSGTLSLNGAHTIRPNNATTGTSKLASLLIAGALNNWSGKLDLTNNKLIIQSTGPADKTARIALLTNQIASGAGGAGGPWTGTGITSSSAAADAAHYAVGLFDNALLNLTTYGGQPTDANSILITIAHLGDANDNGIVDIQDLTIVANHWQTSQNNWAAGDLNRDNIVDIQDFTLVANNWQQSSAFPLSAADILISNPSTSGLTPQNSGPSGVPEPSSLLLLSLLSPLLLRPNSRKHRSFPSRGIHA